MIPLTTGQQFQCHRPPLVSGVNDTADHLSIEQSSVVEPHPVPHTVPDPVPYPDPVLHPDPVPHPVPQSVLHLDPVPHMDLVLHLDPVPNTVPHPYEYNNLLRNNLDKKLHHASKNKGVQVH
jgi:hypothetical protein